MLIDFEREKDRINRAKHGLPLSYARYVLEDDHRIETLDVREDYGEDRIKAVGRAFERIFVCVYTERADVVHVISLRKANGKETREYYEN